MGYKEAIFQRGKKVAADFAAATNVATAVTIVTLTHDAQGLIVGNTLDTNLVLVIGGADAVELGPNEGLVLSANAINRHVQAGAIKGYYSNSAPSTGDIRVTGVI